MNIEKAIKSIVRFETLPPQIDYRLPWKIKATKAYDFLETLPEDEKQSVLKIIHNEINEYHDKVVFEDDNGNKYTASDMNNLF